MTLSHSSDDIMIRK